MANDQAEPVTTVNYMISSSSTLACLATCLITQSAIKRAARDAMSSKDSFHKNPTGMETNVVGLTTGCKRNVEMKRYFTVMLLFVPSVINEVCQQHLSNPIPMAVLINASRSIFSNCE